MEVFHIQGYETRVLAASLRHPVHISKAALAGAHAATMPYKVFKQLVHHPLTDAGLAKFMEDWKSANTPVAAKG